MNELIFLITCAGIILLFKVADWYKTYRENKAFHKQLDEQFERFQQQRKDDYKRIAELMAPEVQKILQKYKQRKNENS